MRLMWLTTSAASNLGLNNDGMYRSLKCRHGPVMGLGREGVGCAVGAQVGDQVFPSVYSSSSFVTISKCYKGTFQRTTPFGGVL